MHHTLHEIDDINTFIDIRRKIHSYPELAFEEYLTSKTIIDFLTKQKIEYIRIGDTGVVAKISKNTSLKSIGLRADMDALPIQESNTFAHASKHSGVMHACGHDGHVAILLCAAYHLKHHIEFDGTVYCIFQPAEEQGGGAAKMIEQGLFDICPMDNIFALHNWPSMPEGFFGIRKGGIMASSNEFRIDIQGKGGHAAMPEQTHDPIVCGASIIQGLQTILTRNISPFEQTVLSITQVQGGGSATNIIEDDMWIGGTVRTFNVEVLNHIEQRMHDIALNIAQAHNCTIKFTFKRSYPPTINSEAETNMLANVLTNTFGQERVNTNIMPSMGAEDFSFMLQQKNGSYFFLGNGNGEGRAHGHGLGPCQLHNDSYDFNDNLIKIGAQAWIALIAHYLS